MVKKMPESPLAPNKSSNTQTQIKSVPIKTNSSIVLENNQQAIASSQLQNFSNPTHANSQKPNKIQSVPFQSSNLNPNTIPKPSYRITSYPIQNKTYRLISLGQQDSSDDDSLNDHDNVNMNVQEDEFRQPLFLPPRFNPFSRWNNRNHDRRRFNNRRNIRSKKTTLQSILSTVRKLYMYIKTARLSSLCQYIPFYPHSPTLYSKYSNISLAILNNSMNLQSAVIKAMEYNIPLMQIIMNPKHPGQEKIVVEKILRDFTIAHFINQNFVLYGDWACFEGYRDVFVRNSLGGGGEDMGIRDGMNINDKCQSLFDEGGKIVFRKGEIVFAEIDLSYVGMIDHNELQQKLQQIRNHYYRQKQLYRNPNSGISSTISQPISSSQSSVGSNGPAQPKTVQQIQEQILKDYLEQKMKEEMRGEEQVQDDEEDYSDDSQEEQREVRYPEDGSSFLRSQLEHKNKGNVRGREEKQQKQQKGNSYYEENKGNDMIESRKKQTGTFNERNIQTKPK